MACPEIWKSLEVSGGEHEQADCDRGPVGIPVDRRTLAAWGVFSSLLLAIGALAIMVFPGLAAVVTLAYMAPMGVYEVALGVLLLVKGVRAPTVA
jgi:hypothetical protein